MSSELKLNHQGSRAQVTSPMIDRVWAALGLILCAPVFLIAGLAIIVEDGCPVFFRQERVGSNGTKFWLWKLRSMRASHGASPLTAAGDSRILRVGRLLRRYKIDELAQLWNVLRGEMRMIGPRPEVPRFVDLRDPTWQLVLSVPPGITDLATLAYRNEEELLAGSDDPEEFYRTCILPAKLALNQRYLRVRSPLTDMRLIALTLWYSCVPSRFRQESIIHEVGLATAAKHVY